MASVFDVAKYILEQKGQMSTWKLQKLCYYSQAWHLAWTGKAIFDEDFEAWSNGPVCPELFHMHQGKFTVQVEDISRGDSGNLTEDQKDSINVVLKDYGDKEPYVLSDWTHQEQPWKMARHGLPFGERCKTVISKESMGEYYGSL